MILLAFRGLNSFILKEKEAKSAAEKVLSLFQSLSFLTLKKEES